MIRHIGRLAICCSLGLTGCTTGARYVTATSTCGIVAIPSNTNQWPSFYHKQAEDLIQAKCPDGYVIEREEEFIPGANQRRRKTDGTSEPAGLFDQAEWRIYYRRKDAPEGSATALMVHPPPIEQPLPGVHPVQLTPVETPLANMPGVNYVVPGIPLSRQAVPPAPIGN